MADETFEPIATPVTPEHPAEEGLSPRSFNTWGTGRVSYRQLRRDKPEVLSRQIHGLVSIFSYGDNDRKNRNHWRCPCSGRQAASGALSVGKLGVDQIVCTGDLPDGTGDLEESCRLLQKNVLTVRGNHDRWLLDGVKRDFRKPTRENRWTTIRYNF